MSERGAVQRLLKLLSSSILDQAILSGANFVIGLLLIRYSTDAQYGYYVLALNGLLLLVSLQSSFIITPMLIRMHAPEAPSQRQLIGGVWRDQRRYLLLSAGIGALAGGLAWTSGALQGDAAAVLIAALLSLPAALFREYFRGMLLNRKRPIEVLVADAVYVAGLLVGAVLAIQFAAAAVIALATSALAALICGLLLLRALGDEVDHRAPGGRVRELAGLGAWSSAGSVIHWTFTQGYAFMAAAILDVTAVAALAAARLLLMPVNLLAGGLQRQLLPIAAGWLQVHGASRTLLRMLAFSLSLAAFSAFYAGIIWLLRDFIFVDLMRKPFAHRDELLFWWSVIFTVTVARDPLMYLLVLREKFRSLTWLTLGCALLALLVSWLGMLWQQEVGALYGVLLGEICSLLGIALLVRQQLRDERTTS